ncbi:superoxide dismutase [Mucisphaera calidilacus]|uniref:Superoxide dismutase n=1 Tax=Mucisphaera calidilacus TaxID=2527982 RepID=A0A518BZZ0_9BACT|nr:superoxide dismutase [Mucisphaera calidilacus]QDU72519.1 Superoxide dismutase [Mn] [Mucisphaera calidilacus]
MDRRAMIGTMAAVAGTAMASAAGVARAAHHEQAAEMPGYDSRSGQYVLPPLPYAYNALDAAIDEQTMRLHHDLHHAGYVRGLNGALAKLAEARESGDYAMVQHWSRKVSFNGGGHTLHTIFWSNMAPPSQGGGGEPEGALRDKIETDFGSVTKFKEHFSAAAGAVEGSGWGILGHDATSGKLIVVQGENQQKLTTWGITPVLVLDVWEHAYYLRYQNRRKEYIKNWWQVVNWSDVASRVSWHKA